MEAQIRRSDPRYRAASIGLFAAGYGCFVGLYCVQPLLPRFTADFSVSPGESAFALSAATGALCVAMLGASVLSDRFGRKAMMALSLLAAGVLTLGVAASPDWPLLLWLRALTGVAVSGVPAVAMAYLGEEMDRDALPPAMGLYIAGSAFGGLSGRVIAGLLVDLSGSWRLALLVVGLVVVVCGLGVLALLPPSRRFTPALPRRPSDQLGLFVRHLRDPVMLGLYAMGFALLGGNVALYNYTGFRLLQPPYGLGETALSAIFLAYLLAGPAASLSRRLSERLGRAWTLFAASGAMLAGVGLTTLEPLPLIVLGVALLASGFFGSHALASAWVTERAHHGRAQASALYLFFYYLGSTVLGPVGGLVWSGKGWGGVAALLALLTLVQGALAISLMRADRRE